MRRSTSPVLHRVAPSLSPVHNDTGRTAFCGPYVVSALTGEAITTVEAAIRAHRNIPAGIETVVEGTYAEDVSAALGLFGYRMNLVASFMNRARKERPTVWTWMQRPRNAWAYYILAVHRGKTGHWILIKGVMGCDTYTKGAWGFVCDGPHRGARIMDVFEVKRAV